MNVGGTKTSPFIMQREQSCQKRSAQIPCVVTDCTSGYRKEKNQILVKGRPCLPPPLSPKASRQSCSPNFFLPNIRKRLNPKSSTSSRSRVSYADAPGAPVQPEFQIQSLPPSATPPRPPKPCCHWPLTSERPNPAPAGLPQPRSALPSSRPRRAQNGTRTPPSAVARARQRGEEGIISAVSRPPAPQQQRGGHQPCAGLLVRGGRCQGEGRRSAPGAGLAARERCGSGAAASRRGLAPIRRRRGLTHDPSRHPVSTQPYPRPFSGAANAALGGRHGRSPVKWWQAVTGDHGNPRCAARPDPASASRSRSPEGSGTSPEKSRRRKRRGGRRTGPPSGGLWAGNGVWGRRSGLDVGPASSRPRVNPSARQSVFPPVSSSRTGDRQLSLSHTAVVKRRCSRAPARSRSQSPRFPEEPQDPAERGGQAGACVEGRVGWAGASPGHGGDWSGGPAPR